MTRLDVRLGPLHLRTPLVAGSGTVGSITEWAGVADVAAYGAAVAKSVSRDPWPGRPAPRLSPTEAGMLNSIGIQNPGIEQWLAQHSEEIASLGVPVWGSAVGYSADEFADVAAGLSSAPISALEVNLSCPNLEGEGMFALDASASSRVIEAVMAVAGVPVGAKLSPNSENIVAIAESVSAAGAAWLTLTNTVWGAAIDIDHRRPAISGVIGGYSGVGMKPVALRCVIEVHRALPNVPILGLGGVRTGSDLIEYVMAGASAVGVGTAHFENPKAGRRILKQAVRWCEQQGVGSIAELKGVAL